MSMLGTLPPHAKKNWPEWVGTLMYGRIPILPIDVEFGVMIPDLANASRQNYAEKLKARLKWAYKTAKENNDWEAARHERLL